MVELVDIPAGDLGTAHTLEIMRELVDESLSDPELARLARELGRHPGHELGELRAWLRSRVRFVEDQELAATGLGLQDVPELLIRPGHMARTISRYGQAVGDCDDVAMLAASVGKIMGFRARFRALSFGGLGDPFLHVLTELDGPSGWEPLDTTRDAQRFSGSVSRQMVLPL